MVNRKNSAFTLIESAVVLVIISMIVAGIIGGKTLIRSSELNTMMSEVKSYKRAIALFSNTYDALPGDIMNAFDYWGTNCNGTAAQCNGNGNGFIGYENEDMMAWKHLELSGLIEGSFSGKTSYNFKPFHKKTFALRSEINNFLKEVSNFSLVKSANAYYQDIGNIPNSKVKGGGFWVVQTDPYGTPKNTFSKVVGNAMIMASLSSRLLRGGIVSPKELKNIDTKYDNGDVLTGEIIGRSAYGKDNNCIHGNNLKLTNKENDCVAVFWLTK